MNLSKALDWLNHLIDQGVEYPIAEFKVVSELNLSDLQIADLQQLYDEQDSPGL